MMTNVPRARNLKVKLVILVWVSAKKCPIRGEVDAITVPRRASKCCGCRHRKIMETVFKLMKKL